MPDFVRSRCVLPAAAAMAETSLDTQPPRCYVYNVNLPQVTSHLIRLGLQISRRRHSDDQG